MIARILMTGSAALVLIFGVVHLVYTFYGPKLTPRDSVLKQRMDEVNPVITTETTIWKVWVGINATHSLALILFGLVYGYLGWLRSDILFASSFLLVIGLAMLGAIAVIAKLYFFSVPFWGGCVALACYVASIAFWRLRP